MEWSTIIFGVILLGITTSALFVFVSAARLYVSDAGELDRKSPDAQLDTKPGRRSMRREGDRRKSRDRVEFPLQLGDLIIESERRSTHDRRRSTVH